MTTSPWFPGVGRTPADEEFLAALRACADEEGLVDAAPADTSVLDWDDALVVLVDLPGLRWTKTEPVLEVIAAFTSPPHLSAGVEVRGWLTEEADPLDLRRVELTPAALGRHTYEWLTAQLRRPVERANWSTWRGERSLIRFADDGELIESDLAAWRRRDRRPDRVEPLRPTGREPA